MAEQQKQQTTQQTTQQKTSQSTKKDAKQTTKPASSGGGGSSGSSTAKKAEPVLTGAEIDRMIDLGLGRGVDATDSEPWKNKSSFQVRRVTAESVIGTEEGGSLQSYEREVSSVSTFQTNLKASVVVPQAPVKIGIDAEHSRSVSSTRRAVGKKVLNRSISFRSDFEDASYADGTAAEDVTPVNSFYWRSNPDSDWSVADTQREYYTFEERLSQWIVRRMLYRQELSAQETVASGGDPGEPKFKLDKGSGPFNPLSVLSQFIQLANKEERKKIIHDCYEFVTHFHITHYVSTIELGAAEYRVLSEVEYSSRIGAGGTFGLEKLANLTVSEHSSWKKTKKASDLKRIGCISSDKVSRGTYDEAVVGIRVQPINTLIKLPYVNLALRKALLYYMDTQGDDTSGPFIVSCGQEKLTLYWSVDGRDSTVHATTNIANASLFFIIPNEDGKYPFEFHIIYCGDNQRLLKKRVSSLTPASQQPLSLISQYLSASVNGFGYNAGPLHLKYHVEGKSRLILEGRLSNHRRKIPISTSMWVTGHDVFFINCTRRTLKRDGYISVRRRRRHGEDEWYTSCVPSTMFHNEEDTFMLFRLLPASQRNLVTGWSSREPKTVDYERQLEEQLELHETGSAPSEFRVPHKEMVQSKLLAVPEAVSTLQSELDPLLAGKHLDTSGGAMPEIPEHLVAMSERGLHDTADSSSVTRDTTL